MAMVLLFLGFLPLMFMADISIGGEADSPDTSGSPDDEADPPPVLQEHGDFVANIHSDSETVQSGLSDTGALEPVTGDETPIVGDDVASEDVLAPVSGDETPVEGDNIDPASVLDPVDAPGDDAPAPDDASPLQALLASETDFDTGSGWLGDYGPDTDKVALGDDDNDNEPDDGLLDTGLGTLALHEGTPVVTGNEPVKVIAGGDGDNTIVLGDDPAYAFGGDGNDTLIGGEGAAALSGGAGNDNIDLSANPDGGWADGGDGNDTLTGGAGEDWLWGGEHDASDSGVDAGDTLSGGGGDDHLAGGYGADTLSGGDGNDVIDHLGREEQTLSEPHHEFGWHIDNDADSLDGGAGNDTLIMDRADSATGGDGSDTFWVYFDSASGSGAADVGDFTVGEDFLRISLNPDLDNGDMALTVEPSQDGHDGVVQVNGETVAILRGAPEATTDDVLVETTENIFS